MLDASRCIHCPDPAPCVEACPAHNDIPSAMWLIEQGQFLEAAELYRQTSSLPEICGRVCPHEQLCQGSCVRNHIMRPCSTGALEAFVTDYAAPASKASASPPASRQGRRSPSSAPARPAWLAPNSSSRKGTQVTIFESKTGSRRSAALRHPQFQAAQGCGLRPLERPGGRPGSSSSATPTSEKIRRSTICSPKGYDAVFVGVGTEIDAPMEVPGEDLPGVYKATEFLIRANVDLELLPEYAASRPVIGRKVAVIGGGDTASDCLRTALRLGADRSDLPVPPHRERDARRAQRPRAGARRGRQIPVPHPAGALHRRRRWPPGADRVHPHGAGRAGRQGSPQAGADRRDSISSSKPTPPSWRWATGPTRSSARPPPT